MIIGKHNPNSDKTVLRLYITMFTINTFHTFYKGAKNFGA